MMSSQYFLLFFFGCALARAWNPAVRESLGKVAHYTPNVGLIMDYFDRIFAAHNISAEKFEMRRSERFANPENRDLSNFISVFRSDEHNVILPGGSNMPPNPVPGTLLSYDNTTHYLVAIVEPMNFAKSDIVLEYSKLNIYNMRSSGFYDSEYFDKMVYIPALPFSPVVVAPNPRTRAKNEVIATFGYTNPRGDRRTEVIEMLGKRGISATMHHFQSLTELRDLYDESKILVNVHQTGHHHTLEEFRVLPALQRGVIVVSEWVPARHVIPFAEYIIFAPYGQLVETVANVSRDYDAYYNKFFGLGSLLPHILHRELADSFNHLERRILKCVPTNWDNLPKHHFQSSLQIPPNRTMLVQGRSNSIYLLKGGRSCEFQSFDDFLKCGFQLGQQFRLSEAVMSQFPVSGPCIVPCD